MRAFWRLVTGPTSEPITLAEAKQQARITHTDEDAVLYRMIKTARETAEVALNRGILTQTWQLVLDGFVDIMALPMAAPLQNDPLASPSTAPIVQYYDPTGTLQTLATSVYAVDVINRPGRIVRAPNQVWPSVQTNRLDGAVFITYVVGWTSADQVPERIKHGMRMYVTYLDCDREGTEQYGDLARKAAEGCWSDRVSWMPPQGWSYTHMPISPGRIY